MKLDQFKKLFEPFGEVMDPHVNSERVFGFIRLVRPSLVIVYINSCGFHITNI